VITITAGGARDGPETFILFDKKQRKWLVHQVWGAVEEAARKGKTRSKKKKTPEEGEVFTNKPRRAALEEMWRGNK